MWHSKHDQCTECTKTDSPYMAKGLCRRCYLHRYRSDPNNVHRSKKHKRHWYEKMGGPEYSRRLREERWFSGNRDAALERDGHKCVRCGTAELLVVHHLDHNGRNSVAPNNDLSNLETLCRACHAVHHSKLIRWSRNHDACIQCGTTERKHNAKGMCWECYLAQPAIQAKAEARRVKLRRAAAEKIS